MSLRSINGLFVSAVAVALMAGTFTASGATPSAAPTNLADSDEPLIALTRVSIEKSKDASDEQSWETDGNAYVMRNTPPRLLIALGCNVHPWLVVGGPAWLDEQHDITIEGHFLPEQVQPFGPLLSSIARSVVRQEFQIRSHAEVRDLPAFALVVDTDGPKYEAMRPAMSDVEDKDTEGALTLQVLTSFLSSRLNSVVVDETDMSGRFFFSRSLDIPRDQLPKALKERYGLALRPINKVEVMVIDEINRSTPPRTSSKER
jgi:uncharacterized protein (TIGR03435 family)